MVIKIPGDYKFDKIKTEIVEVKEITVIEKLKTEEIIIKEKPLIEIIEKIGGYIG